MLTHLEQVRGARRAEALYCSVDEALYPCLDLPKRWDLGYLGTYSPDRQPTLEALLLEPARQLPGMRFLVAGPQYPDGIDWPANVERIEHLPPADHPAFYNAQRFTLNVTRAAMRRMGWSPGRAIAIARNAEDVVRCLRGTDCAQSRRLGQAARQVVLAGHTGRARARQMIAAIAAAPVKA